MKFFSWFTALLAGAVGIAGASDDCVELAVSVRHAVKADSAAVLEIVDARTVASPDCACETVKAAIEASEAEPELVGAIVETAVMAAPEHMRLIAQCALAAAPDALSEIQAVMIRLAPSQGEAAPSAKSAKGPKAPIDVLPAWNPLDFPGEGIGPSPGTWIPEAPIPVPPVPPVINPPVVEPPVGTPTDPGQDDNDLE